MLVNFKVKNGGTVELSFLKDWFTKGEDEHFSCLLSLLLSSRHGTVVPCHGLIKAIAKDVHKLNTSSVVIIIENFDPPVVKLYHDDPDKQKGYTLQWEKDVSA